MSSARWVGMNNEMTTIQYAMADAHETMMIAMSDNRWADVAKYAAQLAELSEKHARLGARMTVVTGGRQTTTWFCA